jgi:Holliday junction resolvase RusA-like endonuclease
VSITLTILDTPTGKGRPRFGNGRAYTPANTINAEARVRAAWQAAGEPRIADGVPMRALVECFLQRPATHYKQNGDLSAAGQRAARPLRKPDVDNAAKLVLDALEGYAYRADAAIVTLWVSKHWCEPGEHERVYIHLEELDT